MKRNAARKWLSRKRALLLTALGRPQGFFIQYRFMDSVDPAPEYPGIAALCEKADLTPALQAMAAADSRFAADATFWKRATRHLGPVDSAAAYAMIGRFAPRRVLEIGSGRSTEVMARAVRDFGLATQITCIDPAPQLDITGLPVRFERRTLTVADRGKAAELEANDVLYIDSSHPATRIRRRS
jgi:hypothetical protein